MEDHKAARALNPYFGLGIPVSAEGRRRYEIPNDLGGQIESGGAVLAFRGVADRINRSLDFENPATRAAQPGELMAASLLLSAMRFLVYEYGNRVNGRFLRDAQQWTLEQCGPDVAEKPFKRFLGLYPSDPVYSGTITEDSYIASAGPYWPNRDAALCELLLLDLAARNNALITYNSLFDDRILRRGSDYATQLSSFHTYLKTLPPFPGTGQDLVSMLYAPLEAAPDSLEGQLAFMRDKWAPLLPEFIGSQFDIAAGVLKEERQFRGLGPGPAQVMRFGAGAAGDGPGGSDYEEPEAFSVDKDWMPNVVLLAKTVYVWLDQLSRLHKVPIQTLDQVPDAELDRLSEWGVTGLWLIGVWERSEASRTIKQMMGNPEAAASAYSLYDYEIAADLGGVSAYEDLALRAWDRGIRLASDMVPNHVGIYSRWVKEHPDWFVQSTESPFPGYTFTGADLSSDSSIGIYIEDGYWDHRDAAVVFKRVDHNSGETRYIYHGNDGTSMPWNDTAQLDYLLPEVRETVIQSILHVARMFPIIRFDAAMTLAKKHYQRLWFPLPEDAGAIPSRAEHGLSRPDFDAVFPVEFWREVVDRVAEEVPDTLLLAEAFWLMEGYFVRTLGMHRVYNSAFMNMLKMEENQKYRQTIKNVLEFSPEILQRFVNFMNNPDEDTAEAQFGKDGKYFGVAAMMVTMPGLPMVGHGQVEGFTEKYGMEYRRAYYDESPDDGLIQRHEREIFPLMRRRHIFSGASDFAFFDFVTPDGWVDENVFAYSNRVGGERAVFIYQNSPGHTEGRVQWSTSRNVGDVDEVVLRQISVGESLALRGEENAYYIYRDSRTGLEHLEHAARIHAEGIYVALDSYQYVCYLGWRDVLDVDLSWGRLHANLAGQGVPSIDDAYQELHLAPLLGPFGALMDADVLTEIHACKGVLSKTELFEERMASFLKVLGERLDVEIDAKSFVAEVQQDLRAIYGCEAYLKKGSDYPELCETLLAQLKDSNKEEMPVYRLLVAWALVRHLGAVLPDESEPGNGRADKIAATSGAWIREWFLRKPIARAFQALGVDAGEAALEASLVRICVTHIHHLQALENEIWGPLINTIFRDGDVEDFLGVNTWQGREWLNQERLQRMMNRLLLSLLVRSLAEGEVDWDALATAHDTTATLEEAAEGTGYDYGWMLTSIK
jgi:glycosidase